MLATPEPAAAGPHLIVSAHSVYAGRIGGAEHMIYNLLRALPSHCRQLDVLCSDTGNLAPAMRDTLLATPSVRLLERGGGGPRFVAEQRACFDRALKADATLFPNYFLPPVRPRRLGRVATVLHDLQYRHHPENFSARKRAFLRAAHALAVRHADRLIVISEFVAQDVRRRYGAANARRLVVIPNPISWTRFDASAGSARPLARPYVLSVAAQYRHKNLGTLLRAFALVAAARPELCLVLCGQRLDALRGTPRATPGLSDLVAELGIADRVQLTGYVDDFAIGQWYRHAEMFAFPSLFEGFGMPPVEALGFGLPTLVSARTSLPEVTLGLAQTVSDACSPVEWAERMDGVLAGPALFRPSAANVARLRAYYAPDRIARMYVSALCG